MPNTTRPLQALKVTGAERVAFCFVSLVMSLLLAGVIPAWAQDQENLANFAHIASAQPAPQERVSLATVAPGLLTYFNNGPVFGVGGTVEGNFWHRTQRRPTTQLDGLWLLQARAAIEARLPLRTCDRR